MPEERCGHLAHVDADWRAGQRPGCPLKRRLLESVRLREKVYRFRIDTRSRKAYGIAHIPVRQTAAVPFDVRVGSPFMRPLTSRIA
jgi:hypothetical protein